MPKRDKGGLNKEALRMIAEKDFHVQSVTRMKDQIEASLCVWSSAILEERVSKVKTDYNKCETKIKQILCSECVKESEKETAQKQLLEMEALMFDLVDKMKMRLNDLESKGNQPKSVTESVSNSVNDVDSMANEVTKENASDAPQVVVKGDQAEKRPSPMKFNGNQSEWCKAYLEKEILDDNEIDAEAKFKLMQEALSETPLLDGVTNIDQAKTMLYKYFDTTYKVTQCQVQKLKAF